jgi:hypothetical protein
VVSSQPDRFIPGDRQRTALTAQEGEPKPRNHTDAVKRKTSAPLERLPNDATATKCMEPQLLHDWLAFDSDVQHPHYTSGQEFKSALPSRFDHQQFYSNGSGERWTDMIPVLT